MWSVTVSLSPSFSFPELFMRAGIVYKKRQIAHRMQFGVRPLLPRISTGETRTKQACSSSYSFFKSGRTRAYICVRNGNILDHRVPEREREKAGFERRNAESSMKLPMVARASPIGLVLSRRRQRYYFWHGTSRVPPIDPRPRTGDRATTSSSPRIYIHARARVYLAYIHVSRASRDRSRRPFGGRGEGEDGVGKRETRLPRARK